MLPLQDCCLLGISDSLVSFKSFLGLYLGGNNLKKLPATITQLLKLRRLCLSGNKRLSYIPELPSTCTCLQRKSPFTEVNKNFLQVLHSRDCMSLSQSSGEKIMHDVMFGIENILPQLRHFHKHDQVFRKEVLVCGLSIVVCLVGDELPPRMNLINENGSTIFVSMEPVPLDFMVVVFSAVVSAGATEIAESRHSFDLHFATEPLINCQSSLVSDSGCTLNKCCSHAIVWENYLHA